MLVEGPSRVATEVHVVDHPLVLLLELVLQPLLVLQGEVAILRTAWNLLLQVNSLLVRRD